MTTLHVIASALSKLALLGNPLTLTLTLTLILILTLTLTLTKVGALAWPRLRGRRSCPTTRPR